jgi:very-short-patch-repair endonuclease
MRHEPSKAEAKMWEMLRDRRLGGYKFRRQVPIAGYIVDFFCAEKLIAIELDSDQHFEENAPRYDARRDARLEKLNIWTFRFPSLSVFKHPSLVRESILEALEREPSPRPSPGVPGEGVAKGFF